MVRIADMTDASEALLRRAAAWYAQNDVPQAFRSLDPKLVRTVRRLSGGDWQRCVVEDESVVVYNTRRWARSADT